MLAEGEACVKRAYKSCIDPPNAQALQASGAYEYMRELRLKLCEKQLEAQISLTKIEALFSLNIKFGRLRTPRNQRE